MGWPQGLGRGDVNAMRMKQKVAVIAAALAVVGGGAIVGAPAASAATVGLTIDCTTDATLAGANPGDTIVITMSTACAYGGGWIWNLNDYSTNEGAPSGFLSAPTSVENAYSSGADGGRTGDDWYVYSDGSGTTTIVTTLLSQDWVGNPLEVGSVVAAMGTSSGTYTAIHYGGGRDASSPRSIWVQGYGRASVDVTCDEGWAPSWDQWPNDGQGGWVCTRVVYEDGSGPAS
jgi:hypothetical protein